MTGGLVTGGARSGPVPRGHKRATSSSRTRDDFRHRLSVGGRGGHPFVGRVNQERRA